MANQAPLTVVVDGQPVTFEGAQPRVYLGRIMVPVRGVFEQIGCYVEYDPAKHVITAQYQNQSVVLRLGNRIANRNGAEILMEVPAVVIAGNALVPLRFLAESIGAHVDYDAPSNTVTIKTERRKAFGSGGG